MAGIWVYAVEPTASDILKTAVGPGVGALVGASLAFHAQAVHKAREEYRRQVAALREAQFAVHYRLVILSAFYKTEMVPVEKNCDRWARVRVKPMAISEMVPPVKVDQLNFLLVGGKPALLEEVCAVALSLHTACSAITRWSIAADEYIRDPGKGGDAVSRNQAKLAALSDAVYRAMPGTIRHLENAYGALVEEMAVRFPREAAYVPRNAPGSGE